MTRSTRKVRSKGFTLTEVLVILTIISLLATLATPSFVGFMQLLQIRACMRQVSQLFRQAQTSTRERYLPHRLVLRHNRLILQIKDKQGWQNTKSHCQPEKPIVLSLNQDPVFYPSGAIVPLCSLKVNQGRRQFTLTISAAGRIRIQRQSLF